MKKILIALFSLCVFFNVLSVAHAADRGAFDVNRWYKILNDIQTKAVQEKINAKTIDAVIQNAVFFPDALYRDQNQAEFKMTMDGYLNRAVNSVRIADGKKKAKEYPTLLRRTHETYSVPPHVILAFWGMESNYGKFKATHKLSDAFLTLIYDGRRETFFTNQLIGLMKIADKGKISIDDLKGSWAGAMGHFQFIPTTWQQYAVDGNGDGKIDIINTVSDAMFSAGNYLNKLGWDQNERIARKVSLPAKFDISLCDAKTKKSLDEWAKLGVTNPDETPIPLGYDMMAGLVCDMTADAPEPIISTNADGSVITTVPRIQAFLTYDNFYRIKKWNNSNYYAIAIAILSDELK